MIRAAFKNSRVVRRWLSQRLPLTSSIVLTQRHIFIFITREGGLYAALLAVTFICGINYANNLVLGLCFFLTSVLVITIHHTYAHLSGLKIDVLAATDSVAGGYSEYRVQIAPTGRQPHRQVLLQWDDAERCIGTLKQPQIEVFQLKTPQRGAFLPPRLTVSSVYPLGLLRAWTYVHFDRVAWVSPQSLACAQSSVQLSPQQDEQHAEQRVRGQDEFESLKDFVAGESMARISWAHLARGQGLLSKDFSDPKGQNQLLDYAHMPALSHEDKLSQLAYWIRQFEQQQLSFALQLPRQHLPLGVGQAHCRAALRLLAEQPR